MKSAVPEPLPDADTATSTGPLRAGAGSVAFLAPSITDTGSPPWQNAWATDQLLSVRAVSLGPLGRCR
jgi:hypothetical protein